LGVQKGKIVLKKIKENCRAKVRLGEKLGAWGVPKVGAKWGGLVVTSMGKRKRWKKEKKRPLTGLYWGKGFGKS